MISIRDAGSTYLPNHVFPFPRWDVANPRTTLLINDLALVSPVYQGWWTQEFYQACTTTSSLQFTSKKSTVCVSVSVRESICCDSRFGAYYNTSIITATRWNLEIVREPESPKLAFHPFRSPLSCHFIPCPHISPTVQSPYSPPVGSAKTGLTGSFQVWQDPARTCHKGLSPQRKLKRHGKARSNMSNDRTCCAPADLGAGANSSSPCAWRHSCTKNLKMLETNAGMLYHQLGQTNTTWTAVDAFLCALYKLYHALALLQLLLQFSAGIFHTCAIRRSFPRRHRPCKWNLHSDVCRCRREPMQCATQHPKSKWAV